MKSGSETLRLTPSKQLHTLPFPLQTAFFFFFFFFASAPPPFPSIINFFAFPRWVFFWVFFVFFFFFFFFFFSFAFFFFFFFFYFLGLGVPNTLGGGANLIFISILSVLPTHILTFLAVWFVVTSRGRRPLWQTLGWSWPGNFGPWKTIGLAVLLLAVGSLITRYLGGSETQVDQIINSSLRARFATAFLAAVTGPLVEELVYRGVLYSAFQRVLGMTWAVVLVSALFAGVHVIQYYNNLAVIAVIALLSVALTLARARSGSLLPSYVMHLVFNGIQAVILVVQPFVGKPSTENAPQVGFLIHSLARLLT